MAQLQLDFVRAQFPAFQEPSLRGHAHFENAGGSFACRYVIWRLHRFYRERRVQPYGVFPASERAGEEMDEARRRMALMLGVEPEEVVFGPSTAQNVHGLAQAFRDWLAPGEAIVVSEQDEDAIAGPWRRLADAGVEVREWRMDPVSGQLGPETLEPLLADGRVRLVCFPHCSSILGEINDLPRVAAMAHRAGAHVCVDGTGYAPHGLPDAGRLGADIYLFSTDMTYGPHQGVMVLRRGVAETLPAQAHGGDERPLHLRFDSAGQDHAQVAAVAGIADYVDALYHRHQKAGRDAAGRAEVIRRMMRAHERRLLAPLLHYLADRNDVRLLGPDDARRRVPTVSLLLDRPGTSVARDLAGLGIMAGGGDFRARRALQALGVPPAHGVLRLSFVHYTTQAEIDRLIAALHQVL